MSTIDFERFFDLSSDLLCVVNEGGHFVRTNASFERMLGWTSHALDGRAFVSLVHNNPEIAAEHVPLLWKIGPGGITIRMCHTDGSSRRVRWLTSRVDPS